MITSQQRKAMYARLRRAGYSDISARYIIKKACPSDKVTFVTPRRKNSYNPSQIISKRKGKRKC